MFYNLYIYDFILHCYWRVVIIIPHAESIQDIFLLKTMAKTGILTIDLLAYLDISSSRFRQHIKYGNIECKGTHLLLGSLTNIYMLSSSAKKRMASDYLIYPYKTDITQAEHDYVLAKIYTCLSYNQKESWMTETQLQSDYPMAKKTADAMYVAGTSKIGVEVITDSYSKDEILLKKEFIRSYCDDFIMIHTRKNIDYTL